MNIKKMKTLAVHAGEKPDEITGATVPSINMATSYRSGADAGFSVSDQGFDGERSYAYTRWANPTIDVLCDKLAALEGGDSAVAFGSGMAAISTLFLQFLKSGDHLLMSDVSYAGASELANEILPGLGIEVTRVNMSNLNLVEDEIRPNTKLIYLESPCNPICRLTDIRGISAMARRVGALSAIDSTFATPIATRPLELGIDIVVHSLTKYLGGHGDAVGGALVGNHENISRIRCSSAARIGGIISPFNAWLINRGLATLPLRMSAHQSGALAVSNFLEQHDKVKKVLYPGLPSHPQHTLAISQMNNFSGMLTFQVENPDKAARLFADKLKIFHYAVSLGHHKSLMFYLKTEDMLKSSFHLSVEQEIDYRSYAGEGVFRVSIGLEDSDDLREDLGSTLKTL